MSLEKAWAQFRAGNAVGAQQTVEAVLSAEPEDVEALTLLGLCLNQRGDKTESVGTLRRAVEIEPESAFAWRVLGALLGADKKNFAEARTAFETALELAPWDPGNHAAMGDFLYGRDKYDDAEAAYNRALELYPDDLDALISLAQLKLDRGRKHEAQALAERAARLSPDDHDLVLLLGDMAFREGRLDEARERALWVLSQNSEDRGALTLLTRVKAKRNPVMGIWLNWAMWMGRFSGGVRVGIILGLWALFQIGRFSFLQLLPPLGYQIVYWTYIGFCIMTWVAPYLFARMVEGELKKVAVRDDY